MKQRRAQGAVRWVVVSTVVVTTAILAWGAYRFTRPVVTITQVIEGPVVNSFYATGTIQPVTEYPIKSANAGILTKVFVDKGDRVKKDQPLAIIEDPQLKFALDKAKANLEQAKLRADEKGSPVLQEYEARLTANATMLDNAKREEQRLTEMAPKGGASKTDVERATDHVKEVWSQGMSVAAQRDVMKITLQTDLRVAEAAVAAAQTDFDRQTLRSPIDGVVLDRPTPAGTRMAVNVSDHVMQIADVRSVNLVMRAQVDEENKPDLRLGQLVHMSLYSFPGRPFQGTVEKIYDKADPDRRTFEVDVKFSKVETHLAAGMTGELAFIIEEKPSAIIAPAQAYQRGHLFTIRDGRLTPVDNAKIGVKSIERIEVVSGLRVGDVVVISPVLDLAPNASVRTTMIDPKIAAGLNSPRTDSTFKGFR